ncbi:hypothetical protein [Bradyrhizobium sp.]|uniref:hypothetical protein n=1 Tax=Bradyrhizobium sp. TaxID=376 RepID=UPI0040381586
MRLFVDVFVLRLVILLFLLGASQSGYSQEVAFPGGTGRIVRENIARSLSDPIFTDPRARIADDAIETLRVYKQLKIPAGNQIIRNTNEPCAFCRPMDPRGVEYVLTRLTPPPISATNKVKACANACHPQDPSLVADYHQRSLKTAAAGQAADSSSILASRVSNYLASRDYAKCKQVFEKHSGDIVGWLKAVNEDDVGSLGTRALAGLKEYVQGCFRQLPANAADPELRRVADRVGQFSPAWREILGYSQDCHGLITDMKLLTAVHCFLNAKPDIGESVTISVPSRMTFKTLAGKKLTLELCEFCHAASMIWTNSRDVIEVPILNAAALTEIASADIPRVKIEIGDQLILFGYSPYERLVALGEAREPLVMKDDMALCSVFDSRDRIVVHGCQTGPGTSGAPIFVRKLGELAIGGVHAGATDALPVPMRRWSPTIANYGVSADAL